MVVVVVIVVMVLLVVVKVEVLVAHPGSFLDSFQLKSLDMTIPDMYCVCGFSHVVRFVLPVEKRVSV